MIESLSKVSQLILITHNRETMSRAGVIYGITMGRDGSSRLLSIAFDEAVAVAKVVEKRTEEILDSLSDKMSAEKSSVIVSESEVDNVQLKKEVVEAEDLIQKTGIHNQDTMN